MDDITEEPGGQVDRPARIVHLRTAEYEDLLVRRKWHARGFAVLGPMEGHDPHIRCPICSTDEPPEDPPEKDCQLCGKGPCIFEGQP